MSSPTFFKTPLYADDGLLDDNEKHVHFEPHGMARHRRRKQHLNLQKFETNIFEHGCIHASNYMPFICNKIYSGAKEENLNDWLRFIKMQERLNYNLVGKIQYYAAGMLIGQAGNWYDSLPYEPINWNDFETKIKKRFGARRLDRATLLKHIHTRKQCLNESVKEFVEDMLIKGEEAMMDRDILLEVILRNMISKNKTLYRLHLFENFNKEKLLTLIDIIEEECN